MYEVGCWAMIPNPGSVALRKGRLSVTVLQFCFLHVQSEIILLPHPTFYSTGFKKELGMA